MNEMAIWQYLMERLNNPYAVAAIMGNFDIESKLNPVCLQGSYVKRLNMTSADYTSKVDAGDYSADEFIHDGAGYGLAQWTYWSRKKSLLDFAKENNKSIGDLRLQLDFFWQEVQLYKTVIETLKSAKSVREASDIFATKYEKPADISDTALQRRADAGTKYYLIYFTPYTQPEPREKVVRVTGNNVNVRVGPGKDRKSIGLVNNGREFQYFGTDANGWNGIVLWLHPDFSEVVSK